MSQPLELKHVRALTKALTKVRRHAHLNPSVLWGSTRYKPLELKHAVALTKALLCGQACARQTLSDSTCRRSYGSGSWESKWASLTWYSLYLLYWYKSTNADAGSKWASPNWYLLYLLYWYTSTNAGARTCGRREWTSASFADVCADVC